MNFLEQLKQLFQPKPKVNKVDIPKRFDLIGRVGQGSMSKVWRARDTKSGKMVALKVLDLIKTKELEARFVGRNKPSEGEIAMQLRHPNVVRTLEHGITFEGEQFLVMEYIEGVSLTYLIETQNEQMQKFRLNFIIQLGEALEYFHLKNWIHRDLCPRNIMVSTDNQVKLIDFGLVVPNTAAFQAPGNRTGTANYMAPELIKRLKTDQRIDVFSYSITCYEMYTKRHPWEAGKTLEMAQQRLNLPPTDIREFVKRIDDQVADTIMKGLEARPGDRWQRIADMLKEFREAETRLEAKQK
ncbi:MAG: Serine/threonine protein kinaserelated protein [Planctomycetaceae bacterium]|nr:Serine/threonine protein kinaserelated protein [Planctomycetaceae bacterium]